MKDFPNVPLMGHIWDICLWRLALVLLVGLALAQPKAKRWRIVTVTAGITALLTVIIVATVIGYFRVPHTEIPFQAVGGGILAVLALLLSTSALVTNRHRWWVLAPLSLSIVVCLLLFNDGYAIYPDTRSLAPAVSYTGLAARDIPAAADTTANGTVPVSQWNPPHRPLRYGVVSTVQIPAPSSKFHARPAKIYLPPAWFSVPRPELPVLVLMPGIPGSPAAWFNQGGATQLANEYQSAHHGLSPIIISVDASGGKWNDPVCTDSRAGNVRTYLTEDVPSFLKSRFNADPDQNNWVIGGLSYGGTCALQTVANAPTSYGAFLNFSGERTPNNGTTHAEVIRKFFGSEANFDRQNPEHILKTEAKDNQGLFANTAGRFYAGKNDASAKRDLKLLHQLAQKAHLDSQYIEVAGGHNFLAWRESLRDAFPFVIERSALPR